MKRFFALLTAIALVAVFAGLALFAYRAVLTALVIPSLLPENNIRPLNWISRFPEISEQQIPYQNGSIVADIYEPAGRRFSRILLLVHGANEPGKDDPRIINFGTTLARAGNLVIIPHFPDLTRQSFSPEATSQVKAALDWTAANYPGKKAGVASFSVASAPMLNAASLARQPNIEMILVFGGHYSAKNLLKHATTEPQADPFVMEILLDQYQRYFGADESIAAIINNRDPERFESLYQNLPPAVLEYMDDLSVQEDLSKITTDTILIAHSVPDQVVPPQESRLIQQAFGERAELIYLESFEHVNVRMPPLSLDSLVNYYIPEIWKVYKLIYQALNF